MAELFVPFTRKLHRSIKPGRDVVAIKRALVHKGVLHQRLSLLTPVYGRSARKAVKTFQRHHGLRATGVYNKSTHRKLVRSRAFDHYGAHLMRVWLAKHRKNKGEEIASAAQYAGAHRPKHYTQGSLRWQAVRLVPWTEHMWDYADCSSFATGCFKEAGQPDPNADGWSGGFTGTLCEHGVVVSGNPEPGDLVFFGSGAPWHHVAVYIGRGLLRSHGYEGGPYLVALHYRSDFGQIRRYV